MSLSIGVEVHLSRLLQLLVGLVLQLSPRHLFFRLILVLLLEKGRLFGVDSDLFFFVLTLKLLLRLATLARLAFEDVQVAKVLSLYSFIIPLALLLVLRHSEKLSLRWLRSALSLLAAHL